MTLESARSNFPPSILSICLKCFSMITFRYLVGVITNLKFVTPASVKIFV